MIRLNFPKWQILIIFITYWLWILGCSPHKGSVIEDSGINLWIDTVKISTPIAPAQIEKLPPLIETEPLVYAPLPPLDANPYNFFLSGGEYNKGFTYPIEEQGLGESDNGVSPKGGKVKEGFRVQVYAGTDLIRAKEMESNVKQKLSLEVYLIYEPPQYKVRVGDFLSRAAAMSFCDSLRQTGFPDAWVVKSLINLSR